jgi:hypothetical protein
MVGEVCSISFGCGEEIAMFGGLVEGSDGWRETIFLFISF